MLHLLREYGFVRYSCTARRGEWGQLFGLGLRGNDIARLLWGFAFGANILLGLAPLAAGLGVAGQRA